MATTAPDGGLDSKAAFARSPAIRAANPVLNQNRLKLGVFGINWVGLAMTNVPGTLIPTWPASLEIGQLADRAGFEAIIPVSRWKSLVPGKPGHRSSQALETFTWATAMAVSTQQAAVFATCHVAAFPPVLAAKQAATLDHISGGRFGLNVVAGWNAREPGMFGAKMFHEHERRYGQATEWMEIVRRVWTSEEEFDFHGDYYDIEGAYTEPRPAQAPGPVVMNAGMSEHGRAFSARYSDMTFVAMQSDDPAAAADTVAAYRAYTSEHTGRDVGVWTHGYVVHEDTDAKAQAVANEMYAAGDVECADAFIAGVVATNSGLSEELHRALRKQIVLGSGGFPLVGSADTIADRLELLSTAGIDGVLLTWHNYAAGLRRFAQEILPRLQERGLRGPPRLVEIAP
jgi:alkanesulfonate monooxygenase SsuD/methylene tetrahydromethanopterin reductase-like flavin-dependent oxidoreductase (luciferase family)